MNTIQVLILLLANIWYGSNCFSIDREDIEMYSNNWLKEAGPTPAGVNAEIAKRIHDTLHQIGKQMMELRNAFNECRKSQLQTSCSNVSMRFEDAREKAQKEIERLKDMTLRSLDSDPNQSKTIVGETVNVFFDRLNKVFREYFFQINFGHFSEPITPAKQSDQE